MSGGVRRFACTQCGACCNRSPEVELSETAALADVFVFRLMFRLYQLPAAPEAGGSAELFYQKKRLLAAHAARKYPMKLMRSGKAVAGTNYLMISALAVDTSPGACAALESGRCGIHQRRPLGCRTVPFHYSRVDGLAASDFDAFVATPGYRCETGEAAPLVLQDSRIVNTEMLQARADALAVAERDRSWKDAIVRCMKRGGDSLPQLRDVEANARFAAMTTSMCIAWQIAVDAGLLGAEGFRAIAEKQLATIERVLETGGRASPEAETLVEMAREYRSLLAS